MYYVNGDLDQFLHVSLLVDNNQVLSQNQHVRIIESPCLWPSHFSP